MKIQHFDWKKWIPNVVILFVFIIASAIYFWPALEGKIIYAADNISGTAAVHESWDYHNQTGDYTFWTGSMFSGIPWIPMTWQQKSRKNKFNVLQLL